MLASTYPWKCYKRLTYIHQRRGEALKVNIAAGEGLQDVLKSNLGPLGTIKMYATKLSRWLMIPWPQYPLPVCQ